MLKKITFFKINKGIEIYKSVEFIILKSSGILISCSYYLREIFKKKSFLFLNVKL